MRSMRVVLLLSASLLMSNNADAGGFTTAKYAGEFLGLGVGARSLGMGSAYVSVARDVTAGYWNPAGLAHLDYPEVMLMHTSQFSGIVNYNYGSFGLPVGTRSSLGFSLIRVGIDDIKETALPNPDLEIGETFLDEDGNLVRNTPFVVDLFGSADYAFYLSYSKLISSGFSLGGNVKLVNRTVGDNSAWGVGFDLGFMFNPVSKLWVGVNLQDITTTMLAWDTGRRELITPTLRSGVSYPFDLSFMGGRITPSMDLIVQFENRKQSSYANLGRASFDVAVGWEYQYRGVFAVRVGLTDIKDGSAASLQEGSSNLGQFTAGAGLHLPKLQIDYAFLEHGLGATHRVSARLTIGEEKFKRK